MKMEINIVEIKNELVTLGKIDGQLYALTPRKEVEIELKKKNGKHKRKPSDCVGFDTTYNVWITKDHVNIFTNILRMQPKGRTAREISELSKIKASRCNATLHWMLEHRKIHKSPTNGYKYCLTG